MCKKHQLLESLDQFIESVHIQQRDRAVRKVANDVEEGFKDYFREQEKRFLEYFEKHKNRFKESISEDEINRIMNEVAFETREQGKEVIRNAAGQLMLFGRDQLISEIGFEIDFDLDHPRAVDFLNKHAAEQVTNIDETTRDRIATIVTQGTEEGWSYQKMAKEIENRFEEFAVGRPQEHIRSRAEHVAVTETAIAYEEGYNEVAEEMQNQGLQMEHYWQDVGDDNVSEGCEENNSVGWIPLDENFPSGDHNPPRFPGCRCASLVRRKRRG